MCNGMDIPISYSTKSYDTKIEWVKKCFTFYFVYNETSYAE